MSLNIPRSWPAYGKLCQLYGNYNNFSVGCQDQLDLIKTIQTFDEVDESFFVNCLQDRSISDESDRNVFNYIILGMKI